MTTNLWKVALCQAKKLLARRALTKHSTRYLSGLATIVTVADSTDFRGGDRGGGGISRESFY